LTWDLAKTKAQDATTMKACELADRYGVAATDDDARRLAQAVKMIF